MNQAKFTKIVEGSLNKIYDIIKIKNAEYCKDEELVIFKRGAELLHTSPEAVLRGFVSKHVLALWEDIDHIETFCKPADISVKKWDDKIFDIIVYMILLRALIIERKEGLDERE